MRGIVGGGSACLNGQVGRLYNVQSLSTCESTLEYEYLPTPCLGLHVTFAIWYLWMKRSIPINSC